MRILEINIPNEASNYFPMYLQVIDLPKEVGIGFDPVWCLPMVQGPDWEYVYSLLDENDSHQLAVIKIDKFTPEMVEKGRAIVMGYCGHVDESIADDESLASIYVHKMICDMYCCSGIFSNDLY